MLDRGDASVKDIDTSMQLGAGHPMGPLQLADYIGLDTLHYIISGWLAQHPEEPAFFMPECTQLSVLMRGYALIYCYAILWLLLFTKDICFVCCTNSITQCK